MEYKSYIEFKKLLETVIINEKNKIDIFTLVLLLIEGMYGFFYYKPILGISLIGLLNLFLSMLLSLSDYNYALQDIISDYEKYTKKQNKFLNVSTIVCTVSVIINLFIMMFLY